jgi:outer membrane protein OmpA-like peptidoglycan-associated protein
MKCSQVFGLTVSGLFLTASGFSQPTTPQRENVPIYRVTVTERTVKAVNYQYRSGPTRIDFRGTVLLPHAKGDAVVESKAGRTEIDAKFDHVEAPTRYGREYLTYVLWAITPEGHPKNLGEVLVGGSDHAKLHVTTDLQAFGMIITAEPYAAVRQPSDVVIMENEVRPDTIGHIEPVQARYELLPRGSYTYEVPSGMTASTTPGVSMERYEEILHVYEAQNAVQIAKAAGADRYAPDTYAKAEQLLEQARDFQVRRADRSTVVTAARQAAQTAEDARAIALRRKQDEEMAHARSQADIEREKRVQAEAELARLKSQTNADRMQIDEERAARERAEHEASALRTVPPPPPQPVVVQVPAGQPMQTDAQRADRARLMQEISVVMPAIDSPRGLVVTIPDSSFRGTTLTSTSESAIARIASTIALHPGLYIQVEGNTDAAGGPSRDEQYSYDRANVVRNILIRSGMPANSVVARGFGSSRPIASNATNSGREQNRRVEIVIAGDPIGTLPTWDRTYSLR